MALINRLAISNMLNINGENSTDWKPSIEYITLDFKGQSSSINLVNGGGKTTIAEAIIGLLSRDSNLLSKTRKKFSPAKKSAWSHVQIELIAPKGNVAQEDLLALNGEDVGGDTYVLGVCGHKGKGESNIFYFYKGTLEEMPIGSKDNIGVSLFPNSVFRENRPSKVVWNIDKAQWLETVKKYIKQDINQLVQFQKNGGGDKSANLFEFKKKRGEPEDATFFYEVLAPAIMSNLRQEQTEEGEYYLEGQILNSVLGLLSNKHKLKKKKKRLDEYQASVALLDPVEEALSETLSSRKRYENKLNQTVLEIQLLQELAIDNPIAGIPCCDLPDSIEGKLIRHFVIHSIKGELHISCDGLGFLINDELKQINKRAVRNHVKAPKLTQAIDFTCHPERIFSTAGQNPRAYTIENAQKIIKFSKRFNHGLTSDSAIQILLNAEKTFYDRYDTNIFRKQLRAVQEDISEKEGLYLQCKKDIEDEGEKIDDYSSRITNRDANQASYNDLLRSDLFTSEELDEPLMTGEKVEVNFKDADTNLIQFREKSAQINAFRQDWDVYSLDYGQQNPIMLERDLIEEESIAEARYKKEQQKVIQLSSDCDECGKAIIQVTSEKTTVESVLERFEEVGHGVCLYQSVFGEEIPVGLDQKLAIEKANKSHKIEQTKVRISEHETLLGCLNKFRQLLGSLSAISWLEGIVEERNKLAIQLATQDNEKKDLQRQRKDLENESISANQYVQNAIGMLRDKQLTFVSLHKAVLGYSHISSERKSQLLATFSSILFSPVFQDKKEALVAARILSEEGISLPIFIEDSLIEYSQTSKVTISNDSELFIGLHAGIHSRQVKCLLDPKLIEKEKARLDQQVLEVEIKITELTDRKKELSDDSENVQLAKSAKQALEKDSEGQIERLEDLLETLDKELVILESKTTEKNIQAIKDMQNFLKLGGSDKLISQKKSMEHLDIELQGLSINHERLRESLKDSTAQEKRFEDSWKSVYPTRLKILLEPAKSFWNQGGPSFIKEEEQRKKHLQVALDLARDRNEFKRDLIKAQAFIDSKKDAQSLSFEQSLEVFKKERVRLSQKAESLQKKVKKLRIDKVPDLIEHQGLIDNLAFEIQNKYKKISALSKDIEISEVSNAYKDSELFKITSRIKEVILQPEKVEALTQLIEDALEAVSDIDIEEYLSTIQRYQRDYKNVLKRLKDLCNRALSGVAFAQPEKDRLLAVSTVADGSAMPSEIQNGLVQFIQRSRLNSEVEEQKYFETEAVFNISFERADKDLAFLISEAASELVLLSKIFRTNQSKHHEVYFNVKADVASGEEVKQIIERIMMLIDSEEEHRSNNEEKGLFVEKEDDYKNKLRNSIRDSIYRDIFRSPTVHFVHSKIRPNGKEYSIGESLSEGQKTAMSLAMTIKLAEFSIARDARRTAPTQMKKAMLSSESILIIDGLFSNLSDPELIASAMDGIEDTRGRFQLLGLIHNPLYQNNFDVFPVYHIGKRYTSRDNSGWLSFNPGKEGTADFAMLAVKRK